MGRAASQPTRRRPASRRADAADLDHRGYHLEIANASFYVTLFRPVKICVSQFTMMAAIFVHPELVVEPGWDQIGAALLVGMATLGITFSLQASFADRRAVDWAVRLALASVALAVLLTPNYPIAIALALPVLGAIIYWLVVRHWSLGGLGAAVTEIDTAGLAASVSSEFGNVS